jgi:hypothetical protein
MSSLLNNASLLLNPAGSIISYQEDKIYSVLPKDGTGDFTFSGGDGGTRVNQQGYIEQTPANLMTYSEAVADWTGRLFNNWVDSSVTSNIVIAPNGTLTGDRLGDGYGRFNVSATAIPGQTYTYSVYLKNVSLTNSFDIVYAWGLNGTLVSYGTATPVNVSTLSTTGWTRITATVTAPSSGINQMQFGPCPFTGYGNPSGQQIDVWGGMVNIGSTALPYQPTTDRLNYPRITYQNGRGALLSEPQRTNLATYSEDLTNGVWSKTFVSITANDTISPDGTQNADRVTRSATTSTYFNNTNTLSSSNRVNSMFFKKGTIDQVTLLGNSYSSGTYATFNLSNGTIINSAGCTPFIEQYRDGWYRCGFVQTNGVNYYLLVTLNGYNNDTVTSGEYLYAWGGQTELGTFPTSYIPTTSATVTRPTDKAFRYSATSLIGQSEGTVYFDFTLDNLCDGLQTNQPVLWYMKDGGAGERYVELISGNKLIYIEYNGAVIADIRTSAITAGRHKCAIAYANNDMVFYVDGVQIGTDTSGTPSGFSTVSTQYYNSFYDGQCKAHSLAPYTSRLSNAQLAELTTVRSGSGGNISYYGPYTIHTFTGSATFTPSFTGPVEVLVVAGGGGGGCGFNKSACGGGGGAGGLLYNSSYGVSAGTGITVTIGAGGSGGPAANVSPAGDGSNGSNSVFGGITTIGGGGGTTYFDTNGKNGGSGGGAGGAGGYTPVGGQGIVGQGNNGGNQVGSGQSTDTTSCGGGGGAGAVGANGVTSQRGGNGGIGLPYSISGFSTYYAGGGGGGASLIGGGFGGLGGGANGGNIDSNGSSAVSYTGGGGGGASSGPGNAATTGGTGGSGIVIVRYLT